MKRGDKAHSLVSASTALLLFLIIFSSTEPVFAVQSDLSAEYAYVPNEKSNTISVINTTTDTVISTVPVGNVPVGVAVSLDGTKVYVTNFGNDDFPGRTVSIIDTATEEVTSMNVEEGRPGKPSGIAVYPYGQKVYVAKFLNEKVRAVDLTTNDVLDIRVGKDPHGVAITPNGSRVYVTNRGDNTVSVIDTATNNITTIIVGNKPYGVAVNKNGTKVYVTNMGSDNVSVIDTATNKVTANVSVGKYPHGVAVTPDEKWVYVANHNTPIGTVSVINTTTNNVTDTIIVGNKPCGVAVNRDGTKVYVTNSGSNTTSVIDTATNKVMNQTISVGTRPSGIGQFIGSVQDSRIETMTILALSPSQSPSGELGTLIVTVSATSQGIEKPSGTVTFIMDGTDHIDKDIISGNATLDISSLSNSSHSIIARYKGNNNFRPSTSPSLTIPVQPPNGKTIPTPTDSLWEKLLGNLGKFLNEIIITVCGGIILALLKKKFFSK